MTNNKLSGNSYVSALLRDEGGLDAGIRGRMRKIPYKPDPFNCDHMTSICAGRLPEDGSIAAVYGDAVCALSWSIDYNLFLERTGGGRSLAAQLREAGLEIRR